MDGQRDQEGGDKQGRCAGLAIPEASQKPSGRRPDKDRIPADTHIAGLSGFPYDSGSIRPTGSRHILALHTTRKEKTLPVIVVRHQQL